MSGKTILPLNADGKGIPAEHAIEDVWKVMGYIVRKKRNECVSTSNSLKKHNADV